MVTGYIGTTAAWWFEGNKVMFLDKERNMLLESTNQQDIDNARSILQEMKICSQRKA